MLSRLARPWVRLLTWGNVCRASIGVCLVYLAATAMVYSTFSPSAPVNQARGLIGGDYIAFHTAGRLVLLGEATQLYEPDRVRALEAEATLGGIPGLYDPFRNPPFFALPFAPLAMLDLVPSFVAWTVISGGLLATAVWLALGTLPSLRPRWRIIACLVFGYGPVYYGLVDGQNTSLSLLLYVLIYRAMLRGRDGQAGTWAALGLFKPQLFIVFPIVFLITRRWRALGMYTVVAAGLAVVSLALVGVEGLLAWTHIIFGFEGGNALKYAVRMHSLKGFWDLLLASQPALALGLALVCSVGLLVPLVRVWRRAEHEDRHLHLRWALTSVVAVLVNPHLLDYDLTVLVLAGLLLAAQAEARWCMLGVYLLVLADATLPVGDVQLQLTIPLLTALAVWLWWRLERFHIQFRSAARPAMPIVRPVSVLGGTASD